MRNPTELMKTILTSETAQKMIDYVAPIYGNSYVGLWIFQAVGTVLDKVCKIGEDLKYETNPMTATMLLDYWEEHYKLEKGSGLTTEQRRDRIAAKIKTKGPCNPATLAAAVSASLGGAPVEIIENTGKNKFDVIVTSEVDSLEPAIAVIERMKPAHLIYEIRVELRVMPTAALKAAVAITYGEAYSLSVPEVDIPDTPESYVSDDTLVLNIAGAYVDGDTLVLPDGSASIDGDTLIIK